MNWVELVQQHWPNISPEDANELLWNATCFPMGDAETIELQIIQAYQKGNGNISQAIAIVEEEMYEEFKRHKVMEVLKSG